MSIYSNTWHWLLLSLRLSKILISGKAHSAACCVQWTLHYITMSVQFTVYSEHYAQYRGMHCMTVIRQCTVQHMAVQVCALWQCTVQTMSVECTMVCISQSPSMAHPAIHCWRAGNYHCIVQTKQPVHNTLYTLVLYACTLSMISFSVWCILKTKFGNDHFSVLSVYFIKKASSRTKREEPYQLPLIYLKLANRWS